MEKSIKHRNSNIELLRIIAILMVLISHFCVHGGIQLINTNNISINMFLVQILQLRAISNHIFIIITGYFLINSKPKYSKIIKLILELFVYSVVIALFVSVFDRDQIGVKSIIKTLLPIFWGNWFIIYYVILYFFSPYINYFINKVPKKELKKCILLMIVLFCLIPTFTKNVWKFTEHDIFILDYFIGAYIKLYFKDSNFKSKKWLILFGGLVLVMELIIAFGGILTNNNNLLMNIMYVIGTNYSIFTLILAILMFWTFNNIKIKNNRIINNISASVLGIYIIHENDFIRDWLWKEFWPNTMYINSNFFIIHLILKVILVFSVCLIIDKIMKLLFGNFEERLSEKIYNFIKRIFDKSLLKSL